MKVLVAIDEHDSIIELSKFVREHHWPGNTDFLILNVVAPVMFDYAMASYPLFLESVQDTVQKGADDLVREMKLRMKEQEPARLHTKVIFGFPASVVIEAAKDWQADLILLGCHGRKGLEKFVVGSVSQAIASHAPCSVVVLRTAPAKETVHEQARATTRMAQAV